MQKIIKLFTLILSIFIFTKASFGQFEPVTNYSQSSDYNDYNQGTLDIYINNIRNDKGIILIYLFAEGINFTKDLHKASIQKIKAQKGSFSIRFNKVPKGEYAAYIIHDENENGILDKKFKIFPKEGTGFSNKETLNFLGFSPSFAKTSFELPAGEKKDIDIDLKYWKGRI